MLVANISIVAKHGPARCHRRSEPRSSILAEVDFKKGVIGAHDVCRDNNGPSEFLPEVRRFRRCRTSLHLGNGTAFMVPGLLRHFNTE